MFIQYYEYYLPDNIMKLSLKVVLSSTTKKLASKAIVTFYRQTVSALGIAIINVLTMFL